MVGKDSGVPTMYGYKIICVQISSFSTQICYGTVRCFIIRICSFTALTPCRNMHRTYLGYITIEYFKQMSNQGYGVVLKLI